MHELAKKLHIVFSIRYLTINEYLYKYCVVFERFLAQSLVFLCFWCERFDNQTGMSV